MSEIKIYKEEVPVNCACHVFIENKLKLVEKMNQLTPEYSGKDLIRLKLDLDVDKLLAGVLSATEKHKWWGWINKNENTARTESTRLRKTVDGIDFFNRSSYYGGWSIKSNSIYCSRQGLTPESSGMGDLPSPISWFIFSSLGSQVYQKLEESQQLRTLTKIAIEQGYKEVVNHLVKSKIITIEQLHQIKFPEEEKLSPFHKEKDGYYDTWGFTDWTQAAIESGIKDITNSANCQLLRSRVAWQRGLFRNYRVNGDHEANNDKWTWHSDEPICHNLRVIIPIQTSNAYGMEIKPHPPRVLEKGYAYTWDTNIVHRQIQLDNTSRLDRIFIVLGFNPWFNWIPEEQAWESNEFYGKVHPLDMLANGLVLPYIKFDKLITE
jgi:hypothetical protein